LDRRTGWTTTAWSPSTNVITDLLGRTVGYLDDDQELELARAIVLAYNLEIPLLD